MSGFGKLLVANRGEIALRVMRSAKALGYRTVAVYSEADAQARHALEADEAVCIGGALPAQSYLNIDAIVDAAKRTGADAVHPGYGFLAENAGFARACGDAGLVFVGPSPQAIEAMGHKAGAKRLMARAGVPCVPGYDGDEQSPSRLAQEAARIGWPLMIKAVAGGGGRGMRLVHDAAQFADALASAQSEAAHAFGDAGVILERALVAPRHVEVQVLADRHGHAIHLGERDCSVQRRHQKLIEEAPSPAVSAELRERIGAVAVQAVRAIGYEGAGTLEFLLDRDGAFFFMEMNTRLQVEHPVTEAITGLDLVALQLRIAAGEPLPLQQHDVRFDGHAIEVRLCAEDAAFMPQSGRLELWQPPAGVRVEHALHSGAQIPPYYDSMIAKVVAHGATRDEARRRLAAALDDTIALGVATNGALLARCLRHPVFAAGGATTAFLAEHGEPLRQRDAACAARAVALAAALFAPAPDTPLRGSRTLPRAPRLLLDGAPVDVTQDVHIVQRTADRVRYACDGVVRSAAWWRDGTRLLLALDGEAFELHDATLAPTRARHANDGDGRLRASMTGRVVALHAAPGQRVAAGQPLVTLEAMKMEHVQPAPCAGTLGALHVTVGEQVSAQRVLAEIVPDAG